MRVFQLPLLVALAHSIAFTLTLALPLTDTDTSPLVPRSQFCTNIPNQKAGAPLHPRVPGCPRCGVTWCDPNMQTYVVIRAGWGAVNNLRPITDLLFTVWRIGFDLEDEEGNRVMRATEMVYRSPQVLLQVANANNHQLTWGVFLEAVTLMKMFLESNGGFQSATFDIFDGEHQVGTGSIS